MSTRCNIQVKQGDGSLYPCMIYKHCDGYPEGVLPFLKPFAEKFVKNRGDDAEYFVAQVLRQWAMDEFVEDLQQPEDSRYARNLTGWGVCTETHGDIEFLYTVDLKDGKVKVKSV